MASNLESNGSTHISVVPSFNLDKFTFKLCGNENCVNKRCNGKQFHCPLCPVDLIAKEKASRLKEHFLSVHVENKRVSHGDLDILRCKLHCKFTSARASKTFAGTPHYHCPSCTNGFPRESEILRHIKTVHHLSHAASASLNTPATQPITASTSQCFSGNNRAKKQKCSTQEATEPSVNKEEEIQDTNNEEFETAATEYLHINYHSVFPTNEEPRVRKSITNKVPCPACYKYFHPNALSQHVRSQHLSSPSNAISTERHLRSVCVDKQNGIYLVRKAFSGGDYVIHVQFKVSFPQCFTCSSSYCKQMCETAARSGDTSYLCSHLKSVHFSETSPKMPELEESALSDLVYKLKWLKPERIEECKLLQSEAHKAGVPLIVCFPLSTTGSTRFRHFSVFIGDKQAKPWSLLNRAIVTCDTESLNFTSKCCGGGFCVHRNIAKWYIKQVEPLLLETEVEDLTCATSTGPKVSSTVLYPPADQDLAKKMVKYMHQEKGIPPDLPIELTVRYSNFKTSYFPLEDVCHYCKSLLSDPIRCTDKGKLLTMSGVIEGISLHIKTCPKCNVPYRYQEYTEGVHNYNDVWLVSLGVLDLIRQHLKVHDAIGRSIQALESWLQLRFKSLPYSIIRNAYLHFEALSKHSYEFSCVLCGFYPPLLVLDVDRKGMFDLAVSELETPLDEELDNWDTVDLSQFWTDIDLGILFRGLSNRESGKTPFDVTPNYHYWAPFIGSATRADVIYNTEHRKCRVTFSPEKDGINAEHLTIDHLMEVFSEGKTSVIKDLARDLGLSDKGSRHDTLRILKNAMGVPEVFIKVFRKVHGGSGGWCGMTCPHGVCYGLKWLLRQEGARDHVDLLKSLKVQPTVTVIDFANMVAAHGNIRFPGMFSPHEGRIAEPSVDNILAAKNGTLVVQWPWFPSGATRPASNESPGQHPITKLADHYALFDSFHEDNSKDPQDLLRRASFVPQLEGVNTEVAEQLNSKRNKDNYFTSLMSPHNNLFIHRLSVHFLNTSINNMVVERHTKEFGGKLALDHNGQLVVTSAMGPSPRPSKCSRLEDPTPANPVSSLPPQSTPANPVSRLPPQSTPANPVSGLPPQSTPANPVSSLPPQSTPANPVSRLPHQSTPAKLPKILVFPQRSGQGLKWLFPLPFSQSHFEGRDGSNACTIISIILCRIFLSSNLSSPSSKGSFPNVWLLPMACAIRTGNSLYDRENYRGKWLSVEEAMEILGSTLPIVAMQPLPVKFEDDHPPSTLKFQLHLLSAQNTKQAHVLTMDGRTVSLLVLDNSDIVVVDTHCHITENTVYGAEVLCFPSTAIAELCSEIKHIFNSNETYGSLQRIVLK